MPSVSKLIERMKYWCLEGNLGYDQYERWNIKYGGECDCSSLVIWCLHEAGFDTGNNPRYGFWPTTGATYTGNMSYVLTQRGWKRLPNDGHPKAGDILLSDAHHVAVYVGNGQLAQASNGSGGKAHGDAAGDQGNETNVRAYYNYPWNCYLRYTGKDDEEVTDEEMRKIANLAADAVWKKLVSGKTAAVRLTEASDDATDKSDPSGRKIAMTTHDHVKWIAAKQAKMDEKLDKLLERDNA